MGIPAIADRMRLWVGLQPLEGHNAGPNGLLSGGAARHDVAELASGTFSPACYLKVI